MFCAGTEEGGKDACQVKQVPLWKELFWLIRQNMFVMTSLKRNLLYCVGQYVVYPNVSGILDMQEFNIFRCLSCTISLFMWYSQRHMFLTFCTQQSTQKMAKTLKYLTCMPTYVLQISTRKTVLRTPCFIPLTFELVITNERHLNFLPHFRAIPGGP